MLPLMLGVEGSEIAGNTFVQALFPIPMLGVTMFFRFFRFFCSFCFLRCFSSYRAFSFPMPIIHALRVPPSAALPRWERPSPTQGAHPSHHGSPTFPARERQETKLALGRKYRLFPASVPLYRPILSVWTLRADQCLLADAGNAVCSCNR